VSEDHPESNIYIKLNPSSSANINVLRKALHGQDVKWAYVQRDADEVLLKATEKKRNGCLKNRNNPSDGLLTYVQELGYENLQKLTDEEVCSAFFVRPDLCYNISGHDEYFFNTHCFANRLSYCL